MICNPQGPGGGGAREGLEVLQRRCLFFVCSFLLGLENTKWAAFLECAVAAVRPRQKTARSIQSGEYQGDKYQGDKIPSGARHHGRQAERGRAGRPSPLSVPHPPTAGRRTSKFFFFFPSSL